MATIDILTSETIGKQNINNGQPQTGRSGVVKASIEGISAVASGMVMAVVITLLFEYDTSLETFETSIDVGFTHTTGLINIGVMVSTFLLLIWDRIPAPFIIIVGLLAGIWL